MGETARGYLGRSGIAREAPIYSSLWPSVNPAPIVTYLPFQDETVRPRDVRQRIATVDTGAFPLPSEVVQESQDGRVIVTLTYNYQEFFLASAFGQMARRDSAGNLQPVEVSPPSGAYRHRFELSQTLHARALVAGEGAVAGDGHKLAGTGLIAGPSLTAGGAQLAGQRVAHRFTLGFQKGDEVWETKSCYIRALAFRFQTDDVFMEADIIGHSLDLASTVNTDLRTLPTQRFHRVLFHDLKIRIAPQSTVTPLAASDEIKVTEFDLEILGTTRVNTTVDTAPLIAEPTFTDIRSMSGRFSPGRYVTGSNLQQWAAAKTPLMAEVFMEGPVIGNGVPFSLHFYLPHVVLIEPETNITGPEVVEPRYTMEISPSTQVLAGIPTGTLGYRYVILDLVSDSDAHSLLP